MGKRAAPAVRSVEQTKSRELALLPGPRSPEWGCSCGFEANWACRIRCQRCDWPAPQRISDAARAAAKTWLPGSPASQGKRAESYAAMVKRLLPLPKGETEAVGDVFMAPVSPAAGRQDPALPGSEQAQLRYWRERRAAAIRYGAKADVQKCDQQVASLSQATQAARPWSVRMQAAMGAHRAAAAKVESGLADLAEARRAVQHFEEETKKAQASLAQAESALDLVQKEGAQNAGPTVELTPAGVFAALDTLAAAVVSLQEYMSGSVGGASGGAGGGAGGTEGVGAEGGGGVELVEQLRVIIAAAVGGPTAEALAGDAAAATGGLAATAPVAAAASAGAGEAPGAGAAPNAGAAPGSGAAPGAGAALGAGVASVASAHAAAVASAAAAVGGKAKAKGAGAGPAWTEVLRRGREATAQGPKIQAAPRRPRIRAASTPASPGRGDRSRSLDRGAEKGG